MKGRVNRIKFALGLILKAFQLLFSEQFIKGVFLQTSIRGLMPHDIGSDRVSQSKIRPALLRPVTHKGLPV